LKAAEDQHIPLFSQQYYIILISSIDSPIIEFIARKIGCSSHSIFFFNCNFKYHNSSKFQ